MRAAENLRTRADLPAILAVGSPVGSVTLPGQAA